jgi:WD40 repeat protein
MTTLILAPLLSWSQGAPSAGVVLPAVKPELVIQSGHSSRVNCAVFSPDHRWLASGSADNSIRLWDVDSGLELRALIGHRNWVRSLAVNRNGELLASGSNDRTIKVWNIASGREMLTLAGHEGVVEAVLFSPDGRWIISGGADRTIRVWDAVSGRELQTLRNSTSEITALAMSPDGKSLASGSADGSIRLWNAFYWNLEKTLNKHVKKINTLVFSPDNRSFASAGDDDSLVLWEAANGKPRFTMRQAGVLTASFIGERELLTTAADRTISTWDTATGKQKNNLAGSGEASEVLFASFSNDGKLLASGNGNRSVEIRAVPPGKFARMLDSHSAAFFSVAFSRDGRWLAGGANDHTVRLWQIATGREMPRLSGHTGWVKAVAFNPNNLQVASASNSGEVKLWDLNSGREIHSESYAGDHIHAIAFSDDGKWLAAAGTAQTIHVLELSNSQKRDLSGHDAEITSLAFIPGSSLIASGSTDKTISLWDAGNGTLVRRFRQLNDQVNAVAVSPDGSILAAGTASGKIELFPLKTAMPDVPRTLQGHSGEIFTLAFSRDGRWLSSAGLDGAVKFWNPQTATEVRSVTGDAGAINCVDFSNDARFLASANEDGSLIVWNTETGSMTAVVASVPNSDDWLVATPSGLFDGSHAAWKLLLWRFTQSTFKVAPVESFFNEFYYPGLLADVLANKNPRAKQDIINKDRRQPLVSVETEHANAGEIGERIIKLRLEVAEAPAEGEYHQGSGARDLRLFRNGLLVQAWSGDILQGASKQTIETSVSVVAGENEFTAYAFNRDNVKSPDATLSIAGAEKLRRTGAEYLFVVGVSKYANANYNLHYSVADATEIAAQLKSQQELLGRYQPVEVISLLDENATKENILLALRILAGTFKGPLPSAAAAELSKIKPAQPEDAVVFYFSGHGVAKGDRFYLIPHDLGYLGPRSELNESGLATILSHSVSDIELEEVLKSLDVDQLLLVIDACNSGQALHATDERRGPMNARGLAQLAYEKGMYVLTASQSDEVAFESAGLKHSYLAYALVEEGIKSGAADINRDGQILLNEWFNYATERVPRIRGRKQTGGKQLEEVDEDEKRVQRPRLFNMREGGAEKFVIARINQSAPSR